MAKPTTKQEQWLYTTTNSRSRRRVKRAVSKARRVAQKNKERD